MTPGERGRGHLTLQQTQGLAWLCAPPQGGGTTKGSSPVAGTPAHLARCCLCLWQDPTVILVQCSIEENVSDACCEGEATWLIALADGQLIPQPEGISLTSQAR